MSKKIRIFISFLLFFSISSTIIFAQEQNIDDSDIPGRAWYISKISGKDNKVGKAYKGPFPTKEVAIANWYYLNLPANSTYAITKEDMYVTKNPVAFYRKQYESVKHEFDFDRNQAIENYNITRDKKIEKQYEKALKKGGQNLANEGTSKEKFTDTRKRSSDVNIEIAPLDETNKNIDIPQEPVPVVEEVKEPEPAVEQTPEPEPVPAPTPEPEPIPEPEPAITIITSDIIVQPIQRYTKEYLADYMIVEEIPEPEDSIAEMDVISNPDEADINGQTLLMKAAQAGNEWQIKTLIDAGANVNLQDKDGWTALMYAVRYQEGVNTVDLLLSAGADYKIKNKYELSALIIAACYNNNPDVIKKFLTFYSISDKEVLKSFALLLSTKQASEYIQIAKINVYLDKSIPLNNFCDGKTPLMYAAQFGNSTKVLKILMDNGAATSVRSTDGKTAFEYATENPGLKHDEIFWSLNRK